MSIEKFRDLLRDPVLRQAWKLGRDASHAEDIFEGDTPENQTGRALYRKMAFNNAFLYCLDEKEPNRTVLTYLLALPAIERMFPNDIAETFGESVACLAAEIDTIFTDDDLASATPLAQEAMRASLSFFEHRLDQANDDIASANARIEQSLKALEGQAGEQAARRKRWDEETERLHTAERRLQHLRDFTHFDPKAKGLKPN